MIGRQRREIILVGAQELDDLPHVQAAADDPGTTGTTAVGDPRGDTELAGVVSVAEFAGVARTMLTVDSPYVS